MIGAVVLAAGGSTRLGRPKQLVLHAGKSLIRRTVDCAVEAGCRPVVAVLGASADAVSVELAGASAEVVRNEGWEEGMSSSIRAGLEKLADLPDRLDGVMLLVCDQPLLTAAVLSRIREAFDGAAGRMVACEYGGAAGVPALFERSRFAELSSLQGPGGAKSVLEAHPSDVIRISWPDGAVDVDEPGDL